MRNRPSPPVPATAASVAVAMTCRVAERNPEKIRGSALGTSTLASTWHAGHAHALGGVAGGRVDALDPGVGAGHERRDRQHDEHDEAGHEEGRVARELGEQPQHHEVEQAQAGDRAGGAREVDDEEPAATGVADGQARPGSR